MCEETAYVIDTVFDTNICGLLYVVKNICTTQADAVSEKMAGPDVDIFHMQGDYDIKRTRYCLPKFIQIFSTPSPDFLLTNIP